MRGSGQRLPITLRFTRVLGTFSHTTCFPFSCALWAFFSDRSVSGERSEPIGAPMPHAALFVVQPVSKHFVEDAVRVFQCRTRLCVWCSGAIYIDVDSAKLFQCRTRLCGWCSRVELNVRAISALFQCRTRLCGWCSHRHRHSRQSPFRCFNAARGFVGGAA